MAGYMSTRAGRERGRWNWRGQVAFRRKRTWPSTSARTIGGCFACGMLKELFHLTFRKAATRWVPTKNISAWQDILCWVFSAKMQREQMLYERCWDSRSWEVRCKFGKSAMPSGSSLMAHSDDVQSSLTSVLNFYPVRAGLVFSSLFVTGFGHTTFCAVSLMTCFLPLIPVGYTWLRESSNQCGTNMDLEKETTDPHVRILEIHYQALSKVPEQKDDWYGKIH